MKDEMKEREPAFRIENWGGRIVICTNWPHSPEEYFTASDQVLGAASLGSTEGARLMEKIEPLMRQLVGLLNEGEAPFDPWQGGACSPLHVDCAQDHEQVKGCQVIGCDNPDPAPSHGVQIAEQVLRVWICESHAEEMGLTNKGEQK